MTSRIETRGRRAPLQTRQAACRYRTARWIPPRQLPRPPARADGSASGGWEGRIARGFRLARVVVGGARHRSPPAAAAAARRRFGALLALVADRDARAPAARRSRRACSVVAPVWVAAYAISFVTIFCNVALVHVVVAALARRARRGCATASRAAARPRRRDRRLGGAARRPSGSLLQPRRAARRSASAGSRFDVAWSVASFFVVPVLVARAPRPRAVAAALGGDRRASAGPRASAARRRSRSRRSWSCCPSSACSAIGLVLYVTGLTIPGLLAMAGAAAAGVAVWIVSVALTQVFTLAVYQHATDGPCFDGFPSEDLERPRGAS